VHEADGPMLSSHAQSGDPLVWTLKEGSSNVEVWTSSPHPGAGRQGTQATHRALRGPYSDADGNTIDANSQGGVIGAW
jgi:hypothetical protein